jgi:hypothetical protein
MITHRLTYEDLMDFQETDRPLPKKKTLFQRIFG